MPRHVQLLISAKAEHRGDTRTTETKQKRENKKTERQRSKRRKRHDTRGLRQGNLSASEGHCRHIYSLCHEGTYFSSSLWNHLISAPSPCN